MPRGDGTGPNGQGPMTGGAFGYCAGYNVPGFASPVRAGVGRGMARERGGGFGLGLAQRRGRGGFGRSAGYAAPYASAPAVQQDEKTVLQAELADLETVVSDIKKRLRELE